MEERGKGVGVTEESPAANRLAAAEVGRAGTLRGGAGPLRQWQPVQRSVGGSSRWRTEGRRERERVQATVSQTGL